MKKLSLILIIIFLFVVISYSRSIEITSPDGKIWFKGKTWTITWATTGSMDPNVKITLRNPDSSMNTVITMSTPNNGSYSWAIPSGFTSGEYIMRVKTKDNLVSDNSGKFKISDPQLAPQKISIMSPQRSKIWFKGKTYNITWAKKDATDPNVKISLLNTNLSPYTVISYSAANNGSYSWTIPSGFTSGYYIIRVNSTENNFSSDSGRFRISGKLSYHGKGLAYKPGKSTAKNTKTPVVTRTPPALPDMIISSIKMSRHKPPGSEGTKTKPYNYLQVIVKNNSNVKTAFPPRSTIVTVTSNQEVLKAYFPSNTAPQNKPIQFFYGDSRKYEFPISSFFARNRTRIPLLVKVDPENVIRESSENNNSQHLIYTLPTPKKADLVIEKIISKGPHTREGFWITIRIKNIGNKKSQSFKHGERIIAITGTSRSEVVAKNFRSLSAGKTKDFKRKIFFGLHIKSRDRISLKIIVDPDNHIPEASEKNNKKNWYTQLK